MVCVRFPFCSLGLSLASWKLPVVVPALGGKGVAPKAEYVLESCRSKAWDEEPVEVGYALTASVLLVKLCSGAYS